MQLMNSSFTKMVVTFIIFIASRSKFPGALRIHIYRCTMIPDPIGLTDRALIVSQKLAIFCLLLAWGISVIARMDEIVHASAISNDLEVDDQIRSEKELIINPVKPVIK